MLLTLEEVGIEAAMIVAVVAAIACFVSLLRCAILERRELRRLEATRRGGARSLVLSGRSLGTLTDRRRAPRPGGGSPDGSARGML
jgi:hypothetical protein